MGEKPRWYKQMCKGSGAENEPTDPGKEVKMDAVDKFRKKKENIWWRQGNQVLEYHNQSKHFGIFFFLSAIGRHFEQNVSQFIR